MMTGLSRPGKELRRHTELSIRLSRMVVKHIQECFTHVTYEITKNKGDEELVKAAGFKVPHVYGW